MNAITTTESKPVRTRMRQPSAGILETLRVYTRTPPIEMRARRFGKLLFDRRQIRNIAREKPAQKKHHRNVDHQLQHSVSHNVPGLQSQYSEQWQHPERIDQI